MILETVEPENYPAPASSFEPAAGDDLTPWLVRAASKVLERVSEGENLTAHLDDLAASSRESGNTERLI